jgi:hypothetical protein
VTSQGSTNLVFTIWGFHAIIVIRFHHNCWWSSYQSRCARSHQVHSSIAIVHSIVHACARAHSTAQYSHCATMKVMVLGLRGDLKCMWCALNHGLLGSSADALERIMLGSIVGALNRSICALEHTNRDQIFLLANSTL